jgi:hypothetical protein
MRLVELEPKFITYHNINGVHYMDTLDEFSNPITLDKAQGIHFLCPKCFAANGKSNYGVHYVEVTFKDRGVPDSEGTHNKSGKPVRWNVSGNDFSNLSTQPSILLEGEGCGWHGFITNGEVSII